jgi:hypothetical protein
MYKIMIIGQRSNFASSLEKDFLEFYKKAQEKDESEQEDTPKDFTTDIQYVEDLKKGLPGVIDIITDQKPRLVIFEGDITKDYENRAIRFINTIGSCPNTSYISLLTEGRKYSDLEDNSLTSENIYFYKGIDHSDVFNYSVSILSPELVEKSNVAIAIYSDDLPLKELAKVTYVARDHAKIETNALLEEGIQKIDFPIHKEVFLSTKHKVSKKITDGTSSQFDHSYKLEFDHVNAPIKKSEKDTILFDLQEKNKDAKLSSELIATWEEQIKASSIIIATNSDSDKKEVAKEVDEEDYYRNPPVDLINLSKSILASWVRENSSKQLGIQQTILVYDSKLAVRDDLLDYEYSNSKRIYIKSDAENIDRDIEKYKPSLIVLQNDDVNTLEDIKRAIASFINYRNYLPYFLIFNHSVDSVVDFQHKMEYHFLISVGDQINLPFIEKVRELFMKKMIESEDNKSNRMKKKIQKASPGEFDDYEDEDFYNYKVFPEQLEVNDTFYIDSSAELVSITEHEIIFRMDTPPRVGKCFKLVYPFPMYIVVAPHIQTSAENHLKNCSRAIIYQMEENQKARLRRYVNSVANLDIETNSVLFTKEIMTLKKEYFPEVYNIDKKD